MSKKKIFDYLRKQWIVVWLVTASSLMMAVIVFAAYKDANTKMKRVIAPTAKIVELFTSNYLNVTGATKTAYFDEGQNTYSFKVDIRNFDPADTFTVYGDNIAYTLNASVVHADGTPYLSLDTGKSITIDNVTFQGSVVSHSFTGLSLTGGSGDTDSFIVTFSGIELGSDYYLALEAVPTVINQSVKIISARVGIAVAHSLVTLGWEGYISDDTNDSIEKYDAFNYTIIGTGNKDLKFSYDPAVIIVNPTLCEYYSEAVDSSTYSGPNSHSGWRTITITARPDDVNGTNVNRYDFQLYKADSTDFASFAALEQYIEFAQSDPA